MKIQNGPGEITPELLKRALGEEWHHSKWQRRKILHISESKVHVDTSFARFREDGSVIVSYDSLYILTKEDGRWGVKMRSSMASWDCPTHSNISRHLSRHLPNRVREGLS